MTRIENREDNVEIRRRRVASADPRHPCRSASESVPCSHCEWPGLAVGLLLLCWLPMMFMGVVDVFRIIASQIGS
jgi:hypothetical protein